MKITRFLAAFLAGGLLFANLAVAQQGTILPRAEEGANCVQEVQDFRLAMATDDKSYEVSAGLLGCAITTGDIPLDMIPYFIQYGSNYLLGLVSLIALIFVIIGGYYYTVGALIEKKEVGKTYIKNALLGMAVAFLAWGIVSVILAAVTS